MSNSTPRIVTIAQLALMPKGTCVSHIKMNEDGSMIFDIQGYLELGPKVILKSVVDGYINVVGELPDIYIEDGRVVPRPDEHCYSTRSDFQHRFVLWPS